MHMTTLHTTAYNRAKTCARAAGVGLPERVSASREAVARGRARAGAFAPVGGALASFIGETLAKAAPGKSRAILFGSRARGDARPDSDWDVLILLDKDRITRSDMDEVSYPVCEFGWGADMMVNPIMYTIRDWDARRGTPFYKNVMRDGIPLWT